MARAHAVNELILLLRWAKEDAPGALELVLAGLDIPALMGRLRPAVEAEVERRVGERLGPVRAAYAKLRAEVADLRKTMRVAHPMPFGHSPRLGNRVLPCGPEGDGGGPTAAREVAGEPGSAPEAGRRPAQSGGGIGESPVATATGIGESVTGLNASAERQGRAVTAQRRGYGSAFLTGANPAAAPRLHATGEGPLLRGPESQPVNPGSAQANASRRR